MTYTSQFGLTVHAEMIWMKYFMAEMAVILRGLTTPNKGDAHGL